MNGVVDGKPARDDRSRFCAQQRVNVNVNFPYGIVSAVSVVVQYCDLQRLILQVLIVNLDNTRRRRAKKRREIGSSETESTFIDESTTVYHVYLKFEPFRVPLWIEGFGTDICFESCVSKLDL